jgi:hypothetical protein
MFGRHAHQRLLGIIFGAQITGDIQPRTSVAPTSGDAVQARLGCEEERLTANIYAPA